MRMVLTPPPESYRRDLYEWALQVRNPGGVRLGVELRRLQSEAEHWEQHADNAWKHLGALRQQYALMMAELRRRGLLDEHAKGTP